MSASGFCGGPPGGMRGPLEDDIGGVVESQRSKPTWSSTPSWVGRRIEDEPCAFRPVAHIATRQITRSSPEASKDLQEPSKSDP